MSTTSVTVQIPPDLLQFGFDRQDIQRRVTEWLVLSLFVEGQISSGKAAKLLHISRGDFLALLKQRGIAYINYTTEELTEEFDAVQQLEVVPPE
jgi:predicted HTH domain antitoxin